MCIIRVPEKAEREQGIENLFEEIMEKNFPNAVKKKIHKSRKCRKSQTRGVQTGPHKDTL